MIELLQVGQIVNTHGVRGELKIVPSTDFIDYRFKPGNRFIIVTRDGQRHEVELASCRPHRNVLLIALRDHPDMNAVLPYKGGRLMVAGDDLAPLDEGEYYFHQIIGCQVVTEDGAHLGEVTGILQPGANDVWEVRMSDGRMVLIPYIDDVVRDIDVEQKLIVIHLLEGLID